MSLATRRLLALTMALGNIALSDESVVTAARSAGVQVAAAIGAAVALGLVLLDVLLLLPHAASSTTMAITNRVAIDHRARRRVDLRDTRWSGTLIFHPPFGGAEWRRLRITSTRYYATRAPRVRGR